MWTISPQKFVENVADLCDKQDKRNKKLQLPICYDSEVSSFIGSDGQKVGLLYSWAVGNYDYGVLGRDVMEVVDLFLRIREVADNFHMEVICYVHNLMYDMSFLYKLLPLDKMFMVANRKILDCSMGKLTFKDSLLLAGGRSLDSVGKILEHHTIRKLVGNLDYNLIRTPETPMTQREIDYQINDIRVLGAYIAEKIESEGSIGRIPATNTGYVRRDLRDSCNEHYQRYAMMMDKLVLHPRAYAVLKKAQAGGFTHAAQHYVGRVLEQKDDIGSYDIKSSYPAVIATEYYPMSAPRCVKPDYANSHLEELCSKYCCTFIVKIENPHTREGWEYVLSESKVVTHETDPILKKKEIESMGLSVFNGRVKAGIWVRYAFTELDWKIYKLFYKQDSFYVEEMWIYERGRLPKQIVVPMVQWFKNKTKLDGDKSAAKEYMIAKNLINAIAGCMEMDPVRDAYVYDFNKREFLDPVHPNLVEAVEKENQNPKRFLYFPWGVWILAHARARLLEVVAHTGRDHIYSDTDSEYLTNSSKYGEYFKALNDKAIKKLKDAAKYYGIKNEDIMPLKANGKPAIMGCFDFEGKIERFVTWGAKRYLYERRVQNEDGTYKPYNKYLMTVAGLNKRKGLEWLCGAKLDYLNEDNKRIMCLNNESLPHRSDFTEKDLNTVGTHTANQDPFEHFVLDMEVPPEYAGRLSMTYVDDRRTGIVRDYLGNEYHYDIMSGVHAEPTGYKMGAVSGYDDILNIIGMISGGGIDDISGF